MTERFLSLIITVLVLLLLIGAWLAQQIGGVSIRLTEAKREIELMLPEVVVRGVPTTVGFREIKTQPTTTGELVWETELEAKTVQTITLPAASVGVLFPCAGPGEGRLLLRQLPDKRVLAARGVQLLAPAEDCALK